MSKQLKILFFHAVSLFVAVLGFLLLLKVSEVYYGYKSQSVEHYQLGRSLYLSNLGAKNKSTRKINFEKFKMAAKNDYLLLFGSSELTNTNHKFIPYNFFPKQFDIPVFAYGHAHFELLGVLGMLSSIESELTENSKIVIVVSPGWFESVNLYPQAFIEHFPDGILEELVKESFTRSVFKKYLLSVKSELSNLTEMQKNILDYSYWKILKYRVNARFFYYRQWLLGRLKKKESDGIFVTAKMSSANIRTVSDYNWEYAKLEARDIEFDRPMSDKTGWVKQDYFEKYLNSTISNSGRKIAYIHPENELWALQALAQFLEKKGIRALFVMQGLNPLYYSDMQDFDPINQEVASILEQYNQHYLNLFFHKVEPGLLTDIMHMGELGWEIIDEEISRIFY